MSDCILKVAYAILDKKGRVIFADEGAVLIYKTKIAAVNAVIDKDEETVKKVCICSE